MGGGATNVFCMGAMGACANGGGEPICGTLAAGAGGGMGREAPEKKRLCMGDGAGCGAGAVRSAA